MRKRRRRRLLGKETEEVRVGEGNSLSSIGIPASSIDYIETCLI